MSQPVPGSPGGGLTRLRLDIAYDGREFSGWARQHGLRTVEGELERILGHLLGQEVELTCAARTDAGVHARGQVVHLDVPTAAAGVGADRINRALPADIRVNSISAADPGFDARFSAIWRRYTYRVASSPSGPAPLDRNLVLPWARPLDVDRMNSAAALLVGEHDFAAFCKSRPFASTVRAVLEMRWEATDASLVLHVRADAFCHSMIRALVGALLPVGDGRRGVQWPAQVLAAREKNSAVTVLPAFPLVLEEVGYPPADGLLARQEQTRAFRGGDQRWPTSTRST